MDKEKIKKFTEEMQKGTGSDYPADKEILAYSAGVMWSEFEKRAHNEKNHTTAWGKIKIDDWKRISDVLMGLFQKGNMNIDSNTKKDSEIRNITSYFFFHVKEFYKDSWNEDDKLNFSQGFSLYM